MASEGDGCTLFARLADDLGEVGMRQQEYQGKSAVVARHGTHNSTSGLQYRSLYLWRPIQGMGCQRPFSPPRSVRRHALAERGLAYDEASR